MNYPLISEYIEAIQSAEDNFEELSYLRPVLGDDGLPVMTSGNFAVVFKMKDERNGKLYAVKCFTKEQQGREEAYHQIAEELKDVDSPYLVSLRYLDKELFVDTEQTTETEFPVLLMDWVEGKTLDKYLRENLDDKYALEMLAYRFSQLGQWLIPQPFAHGDLKPDNILVRDDGTLVLVDYDGMYVPAMKGQKARELGSPDFRHPLRTENDFDEHIDDFSIISILISLKGLCIAPKLLERKDSPNRLLFSSVDYLDIAKCEFLRRLFPSQDDEFNKVVSLYFLWDKLSKREILTVISLTHPIYNYSTSYKKEELLNAIEIDYVLYSKDKRKLLKLKNDINASQDDCQIVEGTEVICDNAFNVCEFGPPYTIWLPHTIRNVGKDAFTTNHIPGISEIIVPQACEQKYRLLMPQYKHLISCYTTKVNKNDISEGVRDEYGAIYSKDGKRLLCCPNKSNLESIVIREGTIVICDGALSGDYVEDDYRSFHYETKLKRIVLPTSLEIIGQGVFDGCERLRDVTLPNSLKTIHCGAFSRSGLDEIQIPKSVEYIADLAFMQCSDLKRVIFESNPIIQSSEIFFDTDLDVIEILRGSLTHFEKYLPKLKDLFVEYTI